MIALADKDTKIADMLEVTGWGATRYTTRSDILQEGMVPYVDNATCDKEYPGSIKPTMLCAGNHTDACQGDSGGPLVSVSNRGNILVGIVETGAGCGTRYGIYSRVLSYSSWILNTISAYGDKI
jgi:secreted trypsin-like serine protease